MRRVAAQAWAFVSRGREDMATFLRLVLLLDRDETRPRSWIGDVDAGAEIQEAGL